MSGWRSTRRRLTTATVLLGGALVVLGAMPHSASPVRGEIVLAPKGEDRVTVDDAEDRTLRLRRPADRTTIIVRRPPPSEPPAE